MTHLPQDQVIASLILASSIPFIIAPLFQLTFQENLPVHSILVDTIMQEVNGEKNKVFSD